MEILQDTLNKQPQCFKRSANCKLSFFAYARRTDVSTAFFRVYNAPESLQFASLDNKLNTLETFWEAEAPRVGESLSQGWRSWNDESEYATPHVTGFQQKSSSADPYVRWVSEESDAVGKRQMSLRSSDDDDGDPYATILFSDIRPLLVSLTTHQAKAMLRLIWLHFLGLRIPGLIASLSPLSLDEKWAEGPCISRSMLSILVPSCNAPDVVSSDSFAGALVGREKAYRNAFSPVKSWGFGVFGVFEDLSMFNEARRWVLLDDNNVELVRNLFRQLRTGDDRDWNVLSIEFEACIGIKGYVGGAYHKFLADVVNWQRFKGFQDTAGRQPIINYTMDYACTVRTD